MKNSMNMTKYEIALEIQEIYNNLPLSRRKMKRLITLNKAMKRIVPYLRKV